MSSAERGGALAGAPSADRGELAAAMIRRGRRTIATASYERGWSEGWNSALARVQELGLDTVLANEARYSMPAQLTLSVERDLEAEDSGAESS